MAVRLCAGPALGQQALQSLQSSLGRRRCTEAGGLQARQAAFCRPSRAVTRLGAWPHHALPHAGSGAPKPGCPPGMCLRQLAARTSYWSYGAKLLVAAVSLSDMDR